MTEQTAPEGPAAPEPSSTAPDPRQSAGSTPHHALPHRSSDRARRDRRILWLVPQGVQVGAGEPYTTIGTFPFHGGFAAILAVGKQKDATTIELPNGGRAVVTSNNPKDIHLAYPNGEYQIEVFDPSAAQARQIVSSGPLTPIG